MTKKMKMKLMDNGDDEWVTAAMRDDTIVADILSRLKMLNASTTTTTTTALERSIVTPAWGFRRRRSSGVDLTKKEGETMGCSPNTPFSWSEFTDGSPSTTGDGGETSSQLNYSSVTPRSKVAITNEVASSSDRKSRNVKELTASRTTFNDHNSRNGRLKRLKVEHIPQHTTRTYAGFYDENDQPYSSNYTQQTPVLMPSHAATYDAPQIDSLKTEKQNSSLSKRNFILPDLNMPPEDDSW